MADYIVKDTELTAIADAIRSKTGGTDQLIFPNGMADAIAGISSGGGGSSIAKGFTFERIPTMFDCSKGYQGWIGNSILKHNGEYAVVTYLRGGHTSTDYDTVTVFFKGYEIERVEQCTFDGAVASEIVGSVLTAWEFNGAYYCYIGKVLYTSTDLIDWTTVTGAAEPPGVPWQVKNIDGVLYAAFDDAYDCVAESTDGGLSWTKITVGSTAKRNEGDFVKAGNLVFCLMGKDWSTSTQTAESGFATICYKDESGWSQLIGTNIICNYGNCASWYDGDHINVLAKSRRYHLDGGDASVLRHYRATVDNAKNGEFELVQRVDDGDKDGTAKYALDSTSIAVHLNDDGTGLVVSPVSSSSGVMRHTYYAINSNVSEVMNVQHEREIAQLKATYAIDKQYGKNSPSLQFAQRVENNTLQTYKPLACLSNGGSQTVSDGVISKVPGFAIKGDKTNGKGLVDVTVSAYSRYSVIGSGRNIGCWYSFGSPNDYRPCRFKGDSAANNSLPFILASDARMVCCDDGENTLFYFQSERYGLIKVIPYVKDNSPSNYITIYTNPYVQGRVNYGFSFKNLEYYNIPYEIPTVGAWEDGVPYVLDVEAGRGLQVKRWADITFDANAPESSGFLNCEGAAVLKFTATENVALNQRLWFYDASKSPVSNGFVDAFTASTTETEITVPGGASYVFFTVGKGNLSKVTVVPSTTATTTE